MSTAGSDLENISFNLKDRFGPLPLELDNLLKEQLLKILASRVGVFSIARSGCGIVFSIKEEIVNPLLITFLFFLRKALLIIMLFLQKGLFFLFVFI